MKDKPNVPINPPPPKKDKISSEMLGEVLSEHKANSEKLDQMVQLVHNLSNSIKVVNDPAVGTPNSKGSENQTNRDAEYDEEDSEDLDVYQYDEQDGESEDEEEEFNDSSLMDRLGSGQKKDIPIDLQVVLWESGRKVTSEYAEGDWKKISIKPILRRCVDHPSANMFRAPKADPQLNDLKFADRKDHEQSFMDIMNAEGTVGALSTQLLVKIQG